MRGYGYRRGDDEAEEPIELREITLLCASLTDLRRLHAFVGKVIAERSGDDAFRVEWHEHFRDQDDRWREGEVDVILYAEPDSGS